MLESDMSYARGLQDQEDYKRLTEEESQIARDCELAAELSASEVKSFSNSSSSLPSLSARGASFYTRQRNRNTCSYCSKSLVGEHKIVEQELLLHHHCFLCAGCGQPIAQSYSKRGDVADGTVEFYHPACSLELFSPRCDLCNDKLSRQYKTHGFFTEKQKYCTRHDIRNHRACTSCNLLEPLAGRGEGFSSLPDGRVICPECVCVIILESSEAQGLYLDAVAFMENSLGMRIPPYMREVPVLAVDLPSLNDQSSLNRHLCGAHPPVKLPSQPGGSNDNSTGEGVRASHTPYPFTCLLDVTIAALHRPLIVHHPRTHHQHHHQRSPPLPWSSFLERSHKLLEEQEHPGRGDREFGDPPPPHLCYSSAGAVRSDKNPHLFHSSTRGHACVAEVAAAAGQSGVSASRCRGGRVSAHRLSIPTEPQFNFQHQLFPPLLERSTAAILPLPD